MILYHGSSLEIDKPDLKHSRARLDFGCGFYTTPLYAQAEKWCQRFIRHGDAGIISCFDFDDEGSKGLSHLSFESYSGDWLDFVLSCRQGEDRSVYDLVSGGIADDRVFNTIELYFHGLIAKDEALRRLKFQLPNYQYCFRTEAALSCLRFMESHKL